VPLATARPWRRAGSEFGATTGRPRRCGWFDAVALRTSVNINSVSGLCLTKLDVLDDFEEIQVCSGYRYKGTLLTEFPAEIKVLEAVKPVYKPVRGWRSQTTGIKDYADLPSRAKDYVQLLSDLTETEFSFIDEPEARKIRSCCTIPGSRTFYG
jgi:adenylosuccinate synthase